MFAVLDTNHFREIALGTPLAHRISERAAERGADVFITVITVQEAVEGWLALIKASKRGRRQIRGYQLF